MQDSQIVRMELKYCECCGGLLLRPAGTGAIYCAGCAARVRELAPPRMPKRRGRPPKSALPQTEAAAASIVVDRIDAVAPTHAPQAHGVDLPSWLPVSSIFAVRPVPSGLLETLENGGMA